MRGLLIKDFKLMKGQKNFFIITLVAAVGMAAFMDDASFVIGYMTFLGAMFTLSSISYDEFDNGNAFLFSMPITRRDYVVEKYVFGLIVGGASWILGTAFTIAGGIMNHSIIVPDTIMGALSLLPILLILLAVMLPFHFKFGGEKSRFAIICAVLIAFAIAFAIVRILALFHIDVVEVLNNLPAMSMGVLIAVVLGVSVVLLFLSYKISVKILNRKEF